MPFSTFNGARVHYELEGRGGRGLAVLLHANPGDMRDYDAVVEHFRDAGFRTLRVDWPGYGQSAPPTGKATALSFASLLEELLHHVEARELTLVGNSVGGFAATRYALSHPENVRALILVSPGGFTRHNPVTRGLCRLMASPRAARRLVGPLASSYTVRRTPWSRAALQRARQVAQDEEQLAVYRQVWGSFTDPRHDLRSEARGLDVPVLLTWGAFDPVLPRLTDGRSARRSLSGSRLVTFPCGHEPHAECPERWWEAVSRFLDEAVPAGDRDAATR